MEIRYESAFWETVVSNFDEIRGPHGEASLQDFLIIDLPRIEEALVNHPPGLKIDNIAVQFIPGLLVAVYAVHFTIGDHITLVHDLDVDKQTDFY